MTLNGFFRGLGDLFQWCFSHTLDADIGLTFLLNTGIVLLGFVGLFYWLNWQRKFNEQAKNDPNQIK